MRKLFFRKQARIEQSFEEFLGCVQRSIDLFATAMLTFLEHGVGESLEKSVELIDKAESKADSVRLDIERLLYRDELLPDSRGDLLSLLEATDQVANRIEQVIKNVYLRRVPLPDQLKNNVKEMLVPVQTAVETLLTAIRLLFTEPRKAKPAADDVDRLESEADVIQYETIKQIYGMDVELALQMQLERLISDLGSIADRAEDAAQVLEIIAIKRTL